MIILQSLLSTLLFLHSAFAVEWKRVLFNDSNTAIQFSGTWNSSAPIPGTTETCDIWTQGAGASATFRFSGTSIQVIGHFPVVYQTISVKVDGSVDVPVARGGLRGCHDVIFQTNGLAKDVQHEIVVTFNGTSVVPDLNGAPLANSLILQGFSYANVTDTNLKRVAVIAGSSGGGGAATIGLGILAYLNWHQISYLLGYLAFALFGWFGYTARRMVFIADPALGQTQITLILTDKHLDGKPEPEDSLEHLVVWKVFDVGGAKREFNLSLPCNGSGIPTLAFGTIDEDSKRVIKTLDIAASPARLQFLSETLQWVFDNNEQEAGDSVTGKGFVVKAENEFDVSIALGTYDEKEDTMHPFLLLKEFKEGKDFSSRPDLYLHAFRTNGYIEGQYKPTLISEVVGDQLTPDQGLRISELSPLTTWLVKPDPSKEGKLKLKVGKNKSHDVKKYCHELKVKRDARPKTKTNASPA